jgi:hypothetical protein
MTEHMGAQVRYTSADNFVPSEQPEESVSRCLRFVNWSTIHDSGKFWSLDGSWEPLLK